METPFPITDDYLIEHFGSADKDVWYELPSEYPKLYEMTPLQVMWRKIRWVFSSHHRLMFHKDGTARYSRRLILYFKKTDDGYHRQDGWYDHYIQSSEKGMLIIKPSWKQYKKVYPFETFLQDNYKENN